MACWAATWWPLLVMGVVAGAVAPWAVAQPPWGVGQAQAGTIQDLTTARVSLRGQMQQLQQLLWQHSSTCFRPYSLVVKPQHKCLQQALAPLAPVSLVVVSCLASTAVLLRLVLACQVANKKCQEAQLVLFDAPQHRTAQLWHYII